MECSRRTASRTSVELAVQVHLKAVVVSLRSGLAGIGLQPVIQPKQPDDSNYGGEAANYRNKNRLHHSTLSWTIMQFVVTMHSR